MQTIRSPSEIYNLYLWKIGINPKNHVLIRLVCYLSPKHNAYIRIRPRCSYLNCSNLCKQLCINGNLYSPLNMAPVCISLKQLGIHLFINLIQFHESFYSFESIERMHHTTFALCQGSSSLSQFFQVTCQDIQFSKRIFTTA